ncbi:cysteine proteinase [Dentipellis sp. KUC8613]|nr:cysteine proteinase [Dentipellis sp. KUC8613]
MPPPPPPLSPLTAPAHPPPRQDKPSSVTEDSAVENEPFAPPQDDTSREETQSLEVPPSPQAAPSHPPAEPAVTSRPQTPTSPRSTTASVPASTAISTSSMTNTNSKHMFSGWVIWSRRPHDPTRAPGIIISPRACPPPDVVEKSLQLPTPPSTPRLKPIIISTPADEEENAELDDIQAVQPTVEIVPVPSADEMSPPTDQLSSSATETETTPGCSTAPDTPIPGSPLSSNTSVSVAGTAPSHVKGASQSPRSLLVKIANVTEPEAKDDKQTVPSAEAALVEAEASTSSTSSVTTPVPSAPAPKKSWASLLRTPGAPTGKGGLPTSSVVGFSVPSTAASAPQSRVIPARRPELVALLSGTAPPYTGAPRIRPRGLINSGNMCFANAVLQLLVYCQPFWRLMNELGKYLPEVSAAEKSETPFVDATVTFLKEFWPEEKGKSAGAFFGGNVKINGNGKGKEVEMVDEDEEMSESFMPTYVYEAMKETRRFENMRGGHQEDAEEFFGFYLDTLEEELLSLLSSLNPSKAAAPAAPANTKAVEEREEETPHEDGWMEVGKRNKMVVTRTLKSTESPITRIFGGKFRSTLRAPHQRDSVMVEDWRALQLDIQRDNVHTIKDALSHISQPQSVQVTSPTRPGVTIEASQQILIESLPPILVLHLKRFLYDVNAKGVVKIGKMVQFTPELEIPQDIMAPGKRPTQPVRYQLYGVLYHHGLSASGGHYTLDVLHPNRDLSTKPREAWIRIDDEFVSDVRPEDVFGGLERDDRCAYLLFYRRIGARS